MKILSTKVHGAVDYIVSLLLIVAPWLFGFARGGAEMWVPVILGILAFLYSLITDYEWSVTQKLSMKAHLTLDVISGIFLAASPWIFHFSDYVYLPHVIVGIFEVLAALITDSTPYRSKATIVKGVAQGPVHIH
jgi:hypothetical protein